MERMTARLLLRPYREDDWTLVQEYAANPEVSRHQAWGPNTEEETQAFLRTSIAENEASDRTAYHFAIVLRDEDCLIGGCTLRVTDAGLREAMIGYTLNPRYWNRGYTTEAARELLVLGFRDLGLHRIVSWCNPENIGSARVMEKAGMRREGHEREAAHFKGEWHDWLRYALLDHEWKQFATIPSLLPFREKSEE